ncbi:MAG TPA: beta-propeller domain-containing protein [Pyrinomonadaceae bacterium]|nr:beta-propeller domain-containing protein [Pyrinomonadaceae bacterium]
MKTTLVKAARRATLFLIAMGFVISMNIGCDAQSRAGQKPRASERLRKTPRKTLRAFGSEQELAKYFRQQAAEIKRERERQRRVARRRAANAPQPAAARMDAGATPEASATSETVFVTSSAENTESVTNVQHAGVDEGGIVKVHGDHLVVLRRGRLFTVAIGDGALKPISAVDAFAPDINPRGTWYDEMLISGDTVVVIGYSYERGGTEVGLFDIGRDGQLRYRSTYHLRSNDYYSSRNYSSRLIGSKLIFYTPLSLSLEAEDPFASLPAMRKWGKGAKDDGFKRIVPATRVYRVARERRESEPYETALHTVTVCDLARGEMECEATAVIGSPGRVFYVSPGSVYVWVNDWEREGERMRSRSMLYQMPLDGSSPSALGVAGSPVDQFSFLESADAHLNVVVRSDGVGDRMWAAEAAAGDVGLLRVPLASFSDGGDAAPPSSYRKLAKPEGYTFQNRFVGEHLLYGTGSGWGAPESAKRPRLYAVRWDGGGALAELPLAHGVDRIEAMGADALVVGTDGKDLHFTGIRLGGEQPALADRYTRKEASQGELRSHGFFYKPDGADSGLLGLPVRGAGRPGYEHLSEGSASILFLRNESLRLNELGELASRAEGKVKDACRASCVDWYGNARPLFLRGRVFALLGYEIVEGAFAENRISETRRISYAPRQRETPGR